MLTDRFITKQTMDRFYEYLIEEERSSGTIEKYIRDVRLLQSWLGSVAGHEGECCPMEARASANQPRTIHGQFHAGGSQHIFSLYGLGRAQTEIDPSAEAFFPGK